MPQWLETAMDYGLSEFDFWKMTIAEVKRFVESQQRKEERRQKETAGELYVLANLIGQSVGRLFGGTYPSIQEIFPEMYQPTEEEIKKQDEMSALRFMQFANRLNNQKKGQEVAKNK